MSINIRRQSNVGMLSIIYFSSDSARGQHSRGRCAEIPAFAVDAEIEGPVARAYSKALREQVLRSVLSGISRRTTAQLFDVSLAFVVKLLQRWDRDRTLEPKRMQAHALEAHAGAVHAALAAHPEMTIDQLHLRLASEGVHVSRASVGRFLVAAGLNRKQRRLLRQPRREEARSPAEGIGAT